MDNYVVADGEKIREPTSEEIEDLLDSVRCRNKKRFKDMISTAEIIWGDTLRYFADDREARNWINANLPS